MGKVSVSPWQFKYMEPIACMGRVIGRQGSVVDVYVPWVVWSRQKECFSRFGKTKHESLIGRSSTSREDEPVGIESYFVSSYFSHVFSQCLQMYALRTAISNPADSVDICENGCDPSDISPVN